MKTAIRHFLLLPLLAAAESYLPPERPLPDLRELTPKSEVVAVSPETGKFRPAELGSSQTLNGAWKLSPLETSERPFEPLSGDERQRAAVHFDDSGWLDARVPLNWFLMKENQYGKVFRKGKPVDTLLIGGSDLSQAVNAYVKGWYRRELELAGIPAGKRAIFSFERIGYEADLFINGKQVPERHHGEFIDWSVDVTDYLKPGKNTLALRVMTNFRPWDGNFTHTHGTLWGLNSTYKAGIWGNARLDWVPAPRIAEVRMITPASGRLHIEAEVVNSGGTPLTVTPGVSVVRARNGAEPNGKEYPPVLLKPGVNRIALDFAEPSPALWTPDEPNLYFATIFFRDGTQVISAKAERFGFRDFEARGTKFYLNGIETYLFYESAHSCRFGGAANDSGNQVDVDTMLVNYKKRGYNMLRTAHMPITREVLDRADELGMMIYNEWGLAFLRKIDEPVFEKVNGAELTRFVVDTHNHPSVVMWSLGNEVFHCKDPALSRQLDKQYDLVKRIDLQKRPVCSFSGMARIAAYGDRKLKTDVIDLHNYVGLSQPWIAAVNLDSYAQAATVYGNKAGKIEMPFIISECVGGGWGHRYDKNYRSNVDDYLKVMRLSYLSDTPGPTGYSGVIGVAAASDPGRGMLYLQNRLGRRVLEQFRLDERYAGFAPWFADHRMASAPVWNQTCYPGLRHPGSFTPRQLQSGVEREVEGFLHNTGRTELKTPVLKLSIQSGGREIALSTTTFPASKPGSRLFAPVRFTIPASIAGEAELKLTLFDGGSEAGRNSYNVVVHPVPAPFPAGQLLPVAVIGDDPRAMALLKRFGIAGKTVKNPQELGSFSRALLAGKSELSREYQGGIRNWVKKGNFLLMLEPEGSGMNLPVFPEYRLVETGAHLVEIVEPEHALFTGMSHEDLDSWAEAPAGNIVSRMLVPLDETVLVGKGSTDGNRTPGMALIEGLFGQGRVVVSTVNALDILDRNSGAAFLMRNLLEYFAFADAKLKPMPRSLPSKSFRTEFNPGTDKMLFVDLRPYANRDFKDDRPADGKGGWTDQGDNDFRNMPLGKIKGAGILFDVIDPAANRGKGCIILSGFGFPHGPKAVRDIAVNAKARAVYFLHTAAFVGTPNPLGNYLIRYADGTSATIPLLPNRNIADWWNQIAPDEAYSAVTVANALTDRVSFFAFEWLNPTPDKEIKSLDFVTTGAGAVPILAAVTLIPTVGDTLIFDAQKQQTWITGHFPEGKSAKATQVKSRNPAGEYAYKVDLPGTGPNTYTFAICRVRLDELNGKAPTHLSLLFRSNSKGRVDLMIPETTWKGSLSTPLDLGLSKGEFIRVRLSLKDDFHPFDAPFDWKNLRPEIGFFNGKDRDNGYPRRDAAFELVDLRYEFEE